MSDSVYASKFFRLFSQHGWLASVCILGLPVVVMAASFYVRANTVAEVEHQLQRLGADYAYHCETFDSSTGKNPNQHTRQLAMLLGNAAVSNFSKVSLSGAGLDDSKLTLLNRLRKLRALELKSNLATDQTLSLISQLPDLRYLTLAGNRFTIMGLLQLRGATELRSLRLDARQLTPIEMAVLKQELVGVDLKQLDPGTPFEYQPSSSVYTPAA